MSAASKRTIRVARTVHIASMVFLVLFTAAAVIGGLEGEEAPDPLFGSMVIVVVAGFTTLGRLIITRAANAIGWIFLGMGAAGALGLPAEAYVLASFTEPYVATLPGTAYAGWLVNLTPALLAMGIPMLFLLFPTGSPPSRRWRWVGWLWAVGSVLSVAWLMFRPGSIYGEPGRFSIENPFGVEVMDRLRFVFFDAATACILVAAILSIGSLVVRFRRARGDERQQIKWLMLVAIAAVAIFVAMGVGDAIDEAAGNTTDFLWLVLVVLLVVGIPAATAFAIFRYRLYDVDVVISKTIVYAGLALFIGAAYVTIVVGVAALLGGDRSSGPLRIATTAAVALAFQPVRDRLQRLANRLVYGSRATPYEVMAEFGHRIASVPSADEVIPDMAVAAARGVGGSASEVSVLLPDGRERSVVWPPGADLGEPTLAIPVVHAGEPIGRIAIVNPRNEPPRPAERALLEDLARHAGLALHNVRLTADLEANAEALAARTEEIRRSRERLVTARDTQRRRLERELRDGVGAELSAIRAELELDASRVRAEPEEVGSSLAALVERANAALSELRDVARGIFPPLLVDEGLAAALDALARKTRVLPPKIDAAIRASRFDPAAENAVYFCCVQALQNVLRHAPGSDVRLRVGVEGGDLTFEVRDDGPGFDSSTVEEREGMQIMRDRVAALDGALTIDSLSGRGTTVRGVVPARVSEKATT